MIARGPLRRALAAVAGQLVATRTWERLGFARLRDYAVERAGHSARSLQDLARVDAALAGLPRVEAALVEGELTWTKTRLLCRVANADDEALWVGFAREKTARALSREVRAVDVGALESGAAATDEDGAPEEERETVQLRCTPAVRARWWRARQLARRVAGEALPVWGCMEVIAAEVLSALPLEVDVEPAAQAANGCAAERACGERELDVTSARTANGCASQRACGESEGEPDVSPRKARALLRLERAGRRARLLREACRDGRLSWVQAHTLLPVLAIASAHQRSWIDWACAVTVRRLQEDVERALVLHETDPTGFEETGGLPAAQGAAEEATATNSQKDRQASRSQEDHQNRQTGAKPTRTEETCRIFWNGPRDVARLFRAVLCTVRRHIERRTGRLPSDGEALDAMLEHVFEAWTAGGSGMGGLEGLGHEQVRAAHRVFARDGWRCTVPGCSSYRELHDHHIRFRSAGGSDAESNRTTLCAWHHLRGVHAGPARLRLRGKAPRRLHFELGLRPGAPALLRYDARDRFSPLAPTTRVSTVSQSSDSSDFLKESAEVDDGLPTTRNAIGAIDTTDRGALSWRDDACSGAGG